MAGYLGLAAQTDRDDHSGPSGVVVIVGRQWSSSVPLGRPVDGPARGASAQVDAALRRWRRRGRSTSPKPIAGRRELQGVVCERCSDIGTSKTREP
ncbi:hypothetical protein SBD_7555 [Streptomyces bottropensis ATCC 25435]|uniref:Uncharacterized protein n=1 Tax=Streptomyces bottropensis ATCC 25435 TaxID=1054862 RepID=M3EP81_9ACTN|nr:hypothetical protein SBD_7555 [Streptomyces bottropensis ATCC 25435]